jgi:hypothetical protein
MDVMDVINVAAAVKDMVIGFQALTSTVANLQASLNYQLANLATTVADEINERSKRQYNLIVFGLPASKMGDKASFERLCKDVLGCNIDIVSYRRLKSLHMKQQPLEVVCYSLKQKENVLRNARKLKTHRYYNTVFIREDRTPLQAQHWKARGSGGTTATALLPRLEVVSTSEQDRSSASQEPVIEPSASHFRTSSENSSETGSETATETTINFQRFNDTGICQCTSFDSDNSDESESFSLSSSDPRHDVARNIAEGCGLAWKSQKSTASALTSLAQTKGEMQTKSKQQLSDGDMETINKCFLELVALMQEQLFNFKPVQS